MEARTKKEMFNELAHFKSNSTIYKLEQIFLILILIGFALMASITFCANMPGYVPEKIYEFAYESQGKYLIFIILFITMLAIPLVQIRKKIKEIITLKVSKYIGKDIQSNSQLTTRNLELINKKSRDKRTTNLLNIIYRANGNYPTKYNVTEELICSLECLYNSVDYNIDVISVYWEEIVHRGKKRYIVDAGADFFAVISLKDRELKKDPLEFFRENNIQYCGMEISEDGSTGLIIIDRHDVRLKDKSDQEITIYAKFSEEIIEKAIKFAEHTIDNN